MAADLAFQISPENLIADFGNFESWSSGTTSFPDGWKGQGTAGSVARESTEIKFGNYSMKIISGASSTYAGEYLLDYRLLSKYQGKTMTFGCWVKCSSASKARIYIDSGSKTYSSYHSGSGSWEFLTVTVQISTTATYIKFGCVVTSATVTAYFDTSMVCEGEFLNTEFRGNNIYVREKDWDIAVNYSIGSFTIPRKYGSQVYDSVLRDGKLRLKAQIQSDSFLTSRQIYDDIVRSVSDGIKDLKFSDDRFVKGILSSIGQLEFQAGARVYVFDLTFTLPIPVHKFLGMIRSRHFFTSSPTSFVISPIGSLKCFPRFNFVPASGTTISSVTIDNYTTGERFSYNTLFGSGNTLIIDTDSLEVSVGGVDGASYFVGDFMKMIPGATNNFVYTGTVGLTLYVDYYGLFL